MKNKIDLLGVKIDPVTKEEAINRLDELMGRKSKSIVCTVNTEFIVRAQNDQEFREIINNSGMNLADGIGVLWAAKFLSLKTNKDSIFAYFSLVLKWFTSLCLIIFYPKYFSDPIPERLSGSDFIWSVAKYARDKNYKLFLLGGGATVAERAALELQTKVYGLKVAGVHSGNPEQTEEIIEAINKSKADILLVAYGAPKQEKWLHENLKKTSCKIGIGLGGTFDFVAGVKKRAPKIMQTLGLEWFFRLILEPKRFIRQLALPKFMIMILKYQISLSK